MGRKLCVVLFLLLAHSAAAAGADIQEGYFKTSDGVKLHYLEAGNGPALFFEPGWSMPAWIWDAQIRQFAPHFRVIALDPRSQGDSEKVSEGNSCERRAQDIQELLEHLKLTGVVLVGWSLGVSELLTYAEQFGGSLVRAYVLVDGFANKQDPQFLVGMMGMYQQVQKQRRQFTEKFVRGMYKKPQPEEYLQRVIEASLKMPGDSAIAASVSAISRADWRPALAKVNRPVLVTCQAALKTMAADPVVSAIPTARVETFADAGHALFVDDRDRFNAVLEDFLKHLPDP